MEQIGLALILFAAFWVGCAAGYIAMRLRAQVAYEKGRNESAAEISALTERLNGRDLQFNEARQRADAGAETIVRMEAELRAETDRRTVAEARLTLLPKYEAEVEARGKKLAEQQAELTKLHVSASELSTRLEEAKRTSEDKINAIQALQSRVTESFQTMSAEALMSNNKAFLDLAGDALARLQESARGDLDQRQSLFGQIMEPLKSSLDRVDTRISELERDRANAYAGLQQQVESMMRSQVSLQAETSHLASALRTPSSRGRWGEVQLRRVVELAGMISHCDFIEPRSTEEGASGRPDLIVQLPNFRQIVVDSKVSLAAYLESNDATDETTRLEKRRAHAAQVRAHVTQLSVKGYWDQFPQSPEFVIAFLPGESFFSAALELDPELLEFGVERRVILATPTTLIALLRAVAWGWKQEMVSSNAREIRDLGKALYDRLRSLADNFTEVQRGLSRTTAAFNRTVGTFESNVIPTARRMRELGASTGDEIVSPPPVDSTPRSLQLLAEATEPAPAAEADAFDATQAPLAKIAVTAAGAQPGAVATRQAVELAPGKTPPPVPVNHTALDVQRSNGSRVPARSAEPQRPVPAAVRPAAADAPKPLPHSLPVPTAEASGAVKPASEIVPAVETVKPQPRIATAVTSEPVTAVKPSVAKPPIAAVVPSPSESSASSVPIPPSIAANPKATTQPPTATVAPQTTAPAAPGAPPPTVIETAATAQPANETAVPQASEPTAPVAPAPSVIEPVSTAKPAIATAVPQASELTAPGTKAPSATEPVSTAKPAIATAVPQASELTAPGAPAPSVIEPVSTAKPAIATAVPQASEPTAPGAPAPLATEPVPAAKPAMATAVPQASEPTAPGAPAPSVIEPVSTAKPAIATAVPQASEPTAPGAPAPLATEPVPAAKPAMATAVLHVVQPTVPSGPAPSAIEPASAAKPKPATATAVPQATQPAAPGAPAPSATAAAVTQATDLATSTKPAASIATTPASEPVASTAPVPSADEPASAVTTVSSAGDTASDCEANEPATATRPSPTPLPSEPPPPITFVLATLPAITEQPLALRPVLPEIEPVSQAPIESLKALAALYSAKPNGKPESAATEPHAQATETPVAAVS